MIRKGKRHGGENRIIVRDDHEAQMIRVIETARWHIVRYDSIRASLATRASFVVSVAALVVAAISFVFSWAAGHKFYGGTVSLALLDSGMLLSLIYALVSIRSATSGLLSSKPWRSVYSGQPPRSLFYTHSDTTKQLPQYADFSTIFKEQTLEMEAEFAMVNLWLVLNTTDHRYKFIRKAVRRLNVAILIFSVVAAATAALGLA
jgi:hypothetical protein